MNNAYRTYLADALDHYMCNSDDDEAIQRFLTFLEEYKPEKGAKTEPDVYEYGDSAGRFVYGYMDPQSLADYGVDRSKLDEAAERGLLTAWTDEIHDSLGDENSDVLDVTLETVLGRLNLTHIRR